MNLLRSVLLIRCQICDYWFAPRAHVLLFCPQCGARSFVSGNTTKHYNRAGTEVVRGIPYSQNHRAHYEHITTKTW